PQGPAFYPAKWSSAHSFRLTLQRHLRSFWRQWSRELFVQLSADPTTEPDERTDAFPACGYDGGLVRHLFYFHADHPDDHQFERLSHWLRLGDCLHEWHSQPIAVHTRRSANAGTD